MHNHPRLMYRDLTPQSRAVMLATRQRFRLAQMQATRRPFTGLYFWIPVPSGEFELLAFADAFYGKQADFARIWQEVIAILALRWRKDPEVLAGQPRHLAAGLPQGQVLHVSERHWEIRHGGEMPGGKKLEAITAAFLLPENHTRILEVNHSGQIAREQARNVYSILNADNAM